MVIELYRWDQVSKDENKGMELIPTSCNDIRMIKVEYLKDQAEKNNLDLVDSSFVVDKNSLPT